jgi:lipoprotein-releasing system ATP-binding protein
MEPILRVSDLAKSYRIGNQAIPVLTAIDLELDEGEMLAIVGQSGSGKSTLLHQIGLLDKPDAGEVVFRGERLPLVGSHAAYARNRFFGFIFQFYHLLPEFTALENVMMPRMVGGAQPADAAGAARGWLEKVGLADRSGHRPGELSGGEQQRVAVARALVNDPEVVLADEPTGNLDDATGEDVHALIRRLAEEENKAFVVVTHKRSFARHADRVLLLTDGRLEPME